MFFTFSGTAPYGHFGNTVTSLLGPLFFAARQNDRSFPLKKKTPRQYGHLVNTVKCFWPIGDRIDRVPYQNFRNRQLLPNFKGPVEKLWRPTIFCQTGNPLFIDSCPSSVHPPKKLPHATLSQRSRNATLTQRFPRLSSFLLVRRALRDHTKNDSDRRLGFA